MCKIILTHCEQNSVSRDRTLCGGKSGSHKSKIFLVVFFAADSALSDSLWAKGLSTQLWVAGQGEQQNTPFV